MIESDPTYLHFEVRIPFEEKSMAESIFKNRGWRAETIGETTYKTLNQFIRENK